MTTLQTARSLRPQPAALEHDTFAPPGIETRPSTLRFAKGNHTYFDGRRWLPSVSGISDRMDDKGGLLGWYADETARCAIEEAAELSRVRRLKGDDAAFEWLRKAPDRAKEGKGTKGSDLHDVADRMLSGRDLPEYLHDDIRRMAEHVLAFMQDYRVTDPLSEVRLAHRSIGYCGTTDQIGVVPQYGDVPIIIDWKTSESMYRAPKFSHGKNAIQLTAYSRAEVMFWDDKTEADMLRVNQDVGLIVMVRPEGYKVYDYDLHRAWPQFVRAFENYHWRRDTSELAHGPVRPRGEDFYATAAAAASLEELIDACHRAVAAGAWNDLLQGRFTQRKLELAAATAAVAAAGE